VAIPFALLIGIPPAPARLLPGLTTMAFAFAAEQWLFTQSFLSNRNQISPILGRGDLNQPAYYLILHGRHGVDRPAQPAGDEGRWRAFRAIPADLDAPQSPWASTRSGTAPGLRRLRRHRRPGRRGAPPGVPAHQDPAQNFTFLGSLSLLVYTVIAGIALLGGAV